MTHGHLNQWRALRRAVGDARLLGSVFVVVGALFLIPLLRRSDGVIERMLTLSASLLLLAPGILYWVAAQSLHRRKPAGAVLARRAAAAHLTAWDVWASARWRTPGGLGDTRCSFRASSRCSSRPR